MGYDLRRIAQLYTDSLNSRLRQERPPLFTTLADDYVLGDPEEETIPVRWPSLFAQMRRILSESDECYVARILPDYAHKVDSERRLMLTRYADALSHDLDCLWLAKRAVAESSGNWDFQSLIAWRMETCGLILQLRTVALFHRRSCSMPAQAARVVESLEKIISVAMAEVAHLVPAL